MKELNSGWVISIPWNGGGQYFKYPNEGGIYTNEGCAKRVLKRVRLDNRNAKLIPVKIIMEEENE